MHRFVSSIEADHCNWLKYNPGERFIEMNNKVLNNGLGFLNFLVIFMATSWSIFQQFDNPPALWERIAMMVMFISPFLFGALTAWNILDDNAWGFRLWMPFLIFLNALLAVSSIDPILHFLRMGDFQTSEPSFLVFGGPVCILNCILMMHRLSNNKS